MLCFMHTSKSEYSNSENKLSDAEVAMPPVVEKPATKLCPSINKTVPPKFVGGITEANRIEETTSEYNFN